MLVPKTTNNVLVLVFAIFSVHFISAGKRRKNENEDPSTAPFMRLKRYEVIDKEKSNMRFENLEMVNSGAEHSVTAQFDLYIDKPLEAPIVMELCLTTKASESSLVAVPFYTTTLKDVCPNLEKEGGIIKSIMEVMGFENKTCPIAAGYYDQKHNKQYVMPERAQEILSSNNFWELDLTVMDGEKNLHSHVKLFLEKVVPQKKTKNSPNWGK